MNDNLLKSTSKFLIFVLRHEPQSIGLHLDAAGWVRVDDLLACAAAAGRPVDRALLQRVVDTNDKQRFAFSDDGLRIRANQGHSIEVALDLPAREPPRHLFHGTATRFLDSILACGLDKRARHHVHLSESRDTALAVGRRHGVAAVLQVDAEAMRRDGHVFFRSDNGVWLTDTVPVAYLQVLS